MKIRTENMISLLNYAIEKRKEDELRWHGTDYKSAELAAWESYLEYAESGPDGFIELTD